MTKGVDETDLALWLRDFAEGLSLEQDWELIEQLKLLGEMTPSKLASEAFLIVERFESSDGQGSELLNHEAWFDRGNELCKLGRYEEAISSYNRAIEINPDNDKIWSNRGSALRILRRYSEAITSYDRAVEINPDNKASYELFIALKDKINIEVLLYALSQQVNLLPLDLQKSLTEIGQVLQANPTDENKTKLRDLIKTYEPLELVYRSAIKKFNQSYTSEERTKSLGTTFQMTSGLDELSIESFLLPANDWVSAAKQLVNNLSSPQTPAQFWDKTDRMAVTTAGGIALGSAIAQIPGAIVGGALGAGYGWYLGFKKTVKQKYTALRHLVC
jgi:tetratricopeptide (TPR) repeat protein